MATTLPWVYKYRPQNFDEVVGNTKAVSVLSGIVGRDVAIPHLLICGPPGCGKTTCVEIMCDLIIRENREARILRSSSFDDRGIDSIRTTVRNFAKARVKTERDPVLEKIVVLDEADSITPGAFQALRGIMDAFPTTTRFILVCNDSAKIIEPVQSRCAIVRFSKVDHASVRSRMATICDTAGVEYTADGTEALARVADGDVRSAINTLSSTCSGFGRVTEINVYRTCDTPRPATISAIVDLLRDKNSFVQACKGLRGIICEDGYCPSDVVSIFFRTLPAIDLTDAQRLEVAKIIGVAQSRMLQGAATYLQLAAVLWEISDVLCRD